MSRARRDGGRRCSRPVATAARTRSLRPAATALDARRPTDSATGAEPPAARRAAEGATRTTGPTGAIGMTGVAAPRGASGRRVEEARTGPGQRADAGTAAAAPGRRHTERTTRKPARQTLSTTPLARRGVPAARVEMGRVGARPEVAPRGGRTPYVTTRPATGGPPGSPRIGEAKAATPDEPTGDPGRAGTASPRDADRATGDAPARRRTSGLRPRGSAGGAAPGSRPSRRGGRTPPSTPTSLGSRSTAP